MSSSCIPYFQFGAIKFLEWAAIIAVEAGFMNLPWKNKEEYNVLYQNNACVWIWCEGACCAAASSWNCTAIKSAWATRKNPLMTAPSLDWSGRKHQTLLRTATTERTTKVTGCQKIIWRNYGKQTPLIRFLQENHGKSKAVSGEDVDEDGDSETTKGAPPTPASAESSFDSYWGGGMTQEAHF